MINHKYIYIGITIGAIILSVIIILIIVFSHKTSQSPSGPIVPQSGPGPIVPQSGPIVPQSGPGPPPIVPVTIHTHPIPPNPPSNVVVESINSNNVTLSWHFPSYNGGPDIIDYIITSDPQTSEVEVIVNSGTSTYIYSGLKSEKTYMFYVQARNSVGVSTIAQSGPVTTP